MAQDMMQIASQFKKDIHEVHMQFYQVSCNRDNLIKMLEGGDCSKMKWEQLEDLALKEKDRNSPSYLHVLKTKG